MRVLFATDGSEYAREAARKCKEITTGFDSVIVKIVTVIDNFTPMATEPFITPEDFLETVQKEIRENAERIVSEAAKILSTDNEDVQIEKEILMGSPKKLIVKESFDWKADLVVMGSQGYGFWSRAVLGSVSDAVVHHAPCSVLIVKKRDENSTFGDTHESE
jgi:nucleotide-binding universal stress UspA family protein